MTYTANGFISALFIRVNPCLSVVKRSTLHGVRTQQRTNSQARSACAALLAAKPQKGKKRGTGSQKKLILNDLCTLGLFLDNCHRFKLRVFGFFGGFISERPGLQVVVRASRRRCTTCVAPCACARSALFIQSDGSEHGTEPSVVANVFCQSSEETCESSPSPHLTSNPDTVYLYRSKE
jgi:hypothetical protein